MSMELLVLGDDYAAHLSYCCARGGCLPELVQAAAA